MRAFLPALKNSGLLNLKYYYFEIKSLVFCKRNTSIFDSPQMPPLNKV